MGTPRISLLFAYHRGTHSYFGNAAIRLLASEEDRDDMEETLSQKSARDVFDWFYFSLEKRSFRESTDVQ